MGIPDQRDPEDARRRLSEWLPTALPGIEDLELAVLDRPSATGFSNETLLFDASYTRDGRRVEQGLVVRVAPTGYTLFPDPAFDVQHRVIGWLDANSEVRVPPLIAHEDDPEVLGAPFFVMERVDGRVPQDNPPYHADGWLVEAEPHERAKVWWGGIDTIAAVHAVDHRAAGFDFLDRPDLGDTPLTQELAYYADFLEQVQRDEPVPTAERALAWLDDHRPRERDEPVLLWGDARIGNIIFSNACEPAAVLDWEMTCLGAPERDVAWALFLDRHHSEGIGAPRLEGFPTPAETVRRYEELTGIRLHDLEYYEVLSGFKFAVIMARLAVLLKQWEVLPPDHEMAYDNTVTRLTDRLLAEI